MSPSDMNGFANWPSRFPYYCQVHIQPTRNCPAQPNEVVVSQSGYFQISSAEKRAPSGSSQQIQQMTAVAKKDPCIAHGE